MSRGKTTSGGGSGAHQALQWQCESFHSCCCVLSGLDPHVCWGPCNPHERIQSDRPHESAWSAVQIAAEKKRRAEEGEARTRQQQERRAAEDAEDCAAARQRATELRNAVAYHREGQPFGRQQDAPRSSAAVNRLTGQVSAWRVEGLLAPGCSHSCTLCRIEFYHTASASILWMRIGGSRPP